MQIKQTNLTAKQIPLILMITLALSACATTSANREYAMADLDPIPAGTIKACVIRPFTFRLKEIEIPVTLNPRTGNVYLQFSYDLATYRQYWDVTNRQAFITALARYEGDYQVKNLNLSRAKARRAYGTVNGFIDWGTFKKMLNSRGYPRVELGYAFVDKSPYFAVTQRETKDVSENSSIEKSSINLTLYFTRALAGELAQLFDQEYLFSLIPPESRPGSVEVPPIESESPPPVSDVPVDEY